MRGGEPIVDDEGHPCLTASAMTMSVTNVFGGVRKMFSIYENDGFHVAAVTAGLAILENMTIAEHAAKFKRECKEELDSVEAVSALFLNYIREKWEVTVSYKEPSEQDKIRPTYPNVEFLAAGFEPSGDGRVYRLDVLENNMQVQYGGQPGIAWAGQANYVERLLTGMDGGMIQSLLTTYKMPFEQLHENVLRHNQTRIDFDNLPTQYAIDFVEMLVNTQAGMQRFEPGIATVGGRTHIGVLRRNCAFQMLNEPELVHKHTGFNHDD